MKSVSAGLITKLRESVEVESKVRLIVEFNLNRYFGTTVSNFGAAADNYDADMFPIDSIVYPDRPVAGISKAWVGDVPHSMLTDGYEDRVNGTRYYMAHKDAKYKYWVSPTISGANPYAITDAAPAVVYDELVWTNKVRLTVEDGFSVPTALDVYTSSDGSTWDLIATNPTINADGTMELYLQSDTSWTSAPEYGYVTQLRGVRVVVNNMSTVGARLEVIELGLRLEQDWSDRVIDFGSEFTMSDISFVAPLGNISSNTASVELDNTDNALNKDNATSIYYKIADKNVLFRMDVGINTGTRAAPTYEYVRQFTMRSVEWPGGTRESLSVSLSDDSEYLSGVKPLPFFYQQMTVGEVVWRILDSIGYTSWEYDPTDNDTSALMPVFYNDGESTVWEILGEIATHTQCAIYFDEYGILQILLRDTAYDVTKAVDWQLNAEIDGSNLADVIDIDRNYEFEANVVNITYAPTELLGASAAGSEILEQVWEPSTDTVVLRSSNVTTSMSDVATFIKITPDDAKLWPFEGLIQVEGEIMRYTGKQYSYRDAGGAYQKKYVTSQDEVEALDKLYPATAFRNAYTGYLNVDGNRGLYGTTAITHAVDAAGWTFKRYSDVDSTSYNNWIGGFSLLPAESAVRLKQTSGTVQRLYSATRNATEKPRYMGTRFKFDKDGNANARAGIIFSMGTGESGCIVEVQATDEISAAWRETYNQEVSFGVKKSDGTFTRYGPNDGRGVAFNIAKDVWYDLDVFYRSFTSVNYVTVMINGVVLFTTTFTDAQGPPNVDSLRHGFFVRGLSSAQFEYFYSVSSSSIRTYDHDFDESTWWNLQQGGYTSGEWDYKWVYNEYLNSFTETAVAKPVGPNGRWIDEFGPIVHEIREFDIKFNKAPVVFSRLYFSNESQVVCPEYTSTPFGAKFLLANASRNNAVVHGSDTFTFGAENAVDQRLFIYGKTYLAEEEEQTETVRDEAGIKKRGEITTDFNSKWIQTEAAAKALGEWITYHWGQGTDQITINTFGNVVLQIGDLVSVNSPDDSFSPSTHKYFVVGKSDSYGRGMETTLTLRRARI